MPGRSRAVLAHIPILGGQYANLIDVGIDIVLIPLAEQFLFVLSMVRISF